MTIVVDRATRQLVGAAMACPDASAAIHECVLAIKARVPVDVLAETIHAFPSTSRIFNGLFADARRDPQPGSVDRLTRPSSSALERDLAVDEHLDGPGAPERAARLDGLVERRGREHDDVGALARDRAARGRARGAERRRRRTPPRSARSSGERLRPARGRRAGRPARILAPDGQGDARPRVDTARPGRRSRTA